MKNNRWFNWLLFSLLALIWGSSFILMKIGLENGLSAFEVAAIRIVASGIVLLPLCFRGFKRIPLHKMGYVIVSGTLGSLLPAFLFCWAEIKLDSSLVGTLNALTPIFVIINGALFFKTIIPINKILGVLVAFSGCIFLLLNKKDFSMELDVVYFLPVIVATFMYGFNINLVGKKLNNLPSLEVTAISLFFNGIPAFGILYFSNFFKHSFHSHEIMMAVGAASLLGIAGTAIATVLFYTLVKNATPVFASMVTYGIPFVALGWGWVLNEKIGFGQIVSLIVILSGVYLANLPAKSRITQGLK